ncbi:MAG: discoidin domain-containing protein, partial [Actinobacteria bacterium]|nr:discoidin domain-containing protein [Actinomycetota bacterium]
AQYNSVKSVRASSYANPITNEPENQASRAFDQIPSTAWTEGAFTSAVNARLNVVLNSSVTTHHTTVLQPQNGSRNRKITKITLTLDGLHEYHFDLSKASHRGPGQQLHFPSQSFSKVNIKVNMTNKGIRKSYVGFSGVGFSEVSIPGVGPARESLRLPTDLLTKAGSLNTPLVILTARLRAPIVPPRFDPELAISRVFTTPAARSFAISGGIRASAEVSDAMINDIVGRSHHDGYSTPQSVATIVQTNSLSRLNGGYEKGSWESADGNPKTSWTPSFGKQNGRWLTYDFSKPISIDHLNLQLVQDGRHSQVRQIEVSAGGATRVIDIPKLPLGTGRPIGAVDSVPVSFPAVYGQQLRVKLSKIKVHYTTDYISAAWIITPPAIAEIGIPGVVEPPTPTELPATCYPAMLSVDGQLVGIRVSGATQAALSGAAMQLTACGGGFSSLSLSAGKHDIETQAGPTYGWNIDSVNLSSAADASALLPDAAGHINLPNAASVGEVKTSASNRSGRSIELPASEAGKWLVFGQSFGPGWSAQANGQDLGVPTLADGYAMAWPLPRASAGGRPFHVVLTWTPQRAINVAQLLSLISLVAMGLLIALGRGRRKRGAISDEAATLTSLWRYEGQSPRLFPLILTSLPLGATCWLIFTPWAGVAVATGMMLAGKLRWSRWLATFGFVSVVLWAAFLVVSGQFHGKFLWNIQWANHFHLSSQLIWLAICLLLADAVLSLLYGRKKQNEDDA